MSTSVFYRALGIRGDKHQSIKQQDGGIVMRVRHDGSELTCPQCDGSNIVRRGTVPRSWSAAPIGRKPVTVFAEVPRIECRDCQAQPVVPVPFADPRRSYTRNFERLVLELRESLTLQDVARHLCVSDWLVKDIEKRWLGRHFATPRLKDLKHIAIDEIATRKGHKSLTIVMDLLGLSASAPNRDGSRRFRRPRQRGRRLERLLAQPQSLPCQRRGGRHRHVGGVRPGRLREPVPRGGRVRLVPHREALER